MQLCMAAASSLILGKLDVSKHNQERLSNT